jgi:hypothetical protein
LDDNELFTSGKDLSLVKCFLKSAQGGCFSDEEIVEYISSEIEKDFLVALIESVEYSFIYFSGHSLFFERLVHIPLLNNDCIKESELIQPNKKQWIFLDCCRTSQQTIQSPDFEMARHVNLLAPGNDIAQEKWKNNISSFDSFYIIYYTIYYPVYHYDATWTGLHIYFFSL